MSRLLALAIVLLLLPAGAANADSYCVDATGCDFDEGGNLQMALTDAQNHAGADTVRIGNVTKSAAGGYSYDSGEAVHIIGTGGRDFGPATGGGTTLKDSTANPTGEIVLKVTGTSASTISGIDVSIPGGSGSSNVGIETNGAIDNVVVHPALGQDESAGPIGVILDAGGSLTDSDVILPVVGNSVAARIGGPGAIRGAGLTAATGILATGATVAARIAQVRIEFAATPVQLASGTVDVDDALMVHRADSSNTPTGLIVSTNGTATLDVNHSTLIGSPSAGAAALLSVNGSSGSANLTFRNGIITGFPVAYYRNAANTGPANITTDYSDYGGSAALLDTGPGTFTQTNHMDVPPGFASATDYHLRPDSPLVDAGDPAVLGAGEPLTDFTDLPRIADGNGDCVARRDIGAFEFTPGPRAPRALATATPAQATTNQQVAFDASLSCDPDGDALTFAWAFDDGTIGTGASVQHAFVSAGRHSATVTVTDASGRATTATAAVTVRVPAKPFAGVSIARQTVKVSKKGVAKVKVKCPKAARGSCTGSLKLTAKLRKRVTVGSAPFKIKRGATRAVSVKLSTRARSALRRNGRLNVTARGTAKDASGLTKVGTGTLVLTG